MNPEEVEQAPEYTGTWIPYWIMLDKGLKPLEKLLCAEISCFKECFASNAYFAERLGMTLRGIEDALKRLRDKGYIRTKSFDGRKRVLEICIPPETTPPEERDSGSRQDVDINNSINNTSLIPKGITTSAERFGKDEVASLTAQARLLGHTVSKLDKYAVTRLVKKEGYARVKAMFEKSQEIMGSEMAPTVDNFVELERKWQKIERYEPPEVGGIQDDYKGSEQEMWDTHAISKYEQMKEWLNAGNVPNEQQKLQIEQAKIDYDAAIKRKPSGVPSVPD